MHICKKIDGQWSELRGVVELEKMVATATQTYADGRSIEVEVEPYPVSDRVDIGKIAGLLADGVWTEADLAPYGLVVAEAFTAPAGKRKTGTVRIVDRDGKPAEEVDVEDIPPPRPPRTAEEKLSKARLTTEEFDDMVAKSMARQRGV